MIDADSSMMARTRPGPTCVGLGIRSLQKRSNEKYPKSRPIHPYPRFFLFSRNVEGGKSPTSRNAFQVQLELSLWSAWHHTEALYLRLGTLESWGRASECQEPLSANTNGEEVSKNSRVAPGLVVKVHAWPVVIGKPMAEGKV